MNNNEPAAERYSINGFKYFSELAKEDFDGFECYHSGHSREDTAALLTYCRQHQLLVSGGSDCHGSFVPSRALGRPVIDSSDLNLPGLL